MTWPSRSNEYNRRRNRAKAYGTWEPYVDAQPARDHVLWLRSQGMGPKRIAEVSGVPHGSLAKLIYGDAQRNLAPSKRIRPSTEARILATQPDLAAGHHVDPLGARRRLRALVALGYTQTHLAQLLGLEKTYFWKILHDETRGISRGTDDTARRIYDELHMRPGPSLRARRMAASKSWPPPLAYDDIDNPHEHRTAVRWPA